MLGRLARGANDVQLRARLATPSARARAAVVGLLIVCAGNVYTVRDVMRLRQAGAPLDWDPRAYAERLANVRPLVPLGARLGYVNPRLPGDIARRQDLFATRYALIPLCVVPGADEPYVLQGDLTLPIDADHVTIREDPQHGWRLVERLEHR